MLLRKKRESRWWLSKSDYIVILQHGSFTRLPFLFSSLSLNLTGLQNHDHTCSYSLRWILQLQSLVSFKHTDWIAIPWWWVCDVKFFLGFLASPLFEKNRSKFSREDPPVLKKQSRSTSLSMKSNLPSLYYWFRKNRISKVEHHIIALKKICIPFLQNIHVQL